MTIFETRRFYWPSGQVRDEYLVLFGLSVRDGWFPIALMLGVLAAPFLSSLRP